MKKIATFPISCVTALLLFAGTATAEARSWRVNSDATKHAHFADINAAMSSSEVLDGDTLYLDPGCNITTQQNVTKKVTIVGTGYFLNTTAHQQACISAPVVMKSAGAKLEGLVIGHGNRLTISADYITVERCSIWDVFWNGTGRYVSFRQCYVTGRIVGNGISNTTSINCTIENCIIYYDWTSASFSAISDMMSAVVRNNYVKVINTNSTNIINNMGNGTIVNNIFVQPRDRNKIFGTLTECVVRKNVMSCDENTYATYPENKSIGTNDESAVFALEGTNDQLYTLKEGSPAIGAATDGGDCGPTGGLYPYVPSGFPFGMPHFQSSSISTRPQSGKVSVSQQVIIQNQ